MSTMSMVLGPEKGISCSSARDRRRRGRRRSTHEGQRLPPWQVKIVGEQDERLHTWSHTAVIHHSGGHDLVKPPGGVADDGGDVADDDADEVEQGVEEHQAPKLQASPNDADKS